MPPQTTCSTIQVTNDGRVIRTPPNSGTPAPSCSVRTKPCRGNGTHTTFYQAGCRGKLSVMRTMVILATVAIGAVRLVLRAFGPRALESTTEWSADE
jgi:hypothetical protein